MMKLVRAALRRRAAERQTPLCRSAAGGLMVGSETTFWEPAPVFWEPAPVSDRVRATGGIFGELRRVRRNVAVAPRNHLAPT